MLPEHLQPKFGCVFLSFSLRFNASSSNQLQHNLAPRRGFDPLASAVTVRCSPEWANGAVYGGDGVSRTHSAVRRRIYSPLGLPIFLHLHKLGAPNRNWTCLRLASNPARNKTSPGHNLVVDRGIEPLLPTWKAGVLTDRRIHQKYHCTHNLKMGSKALLGTVIQTLYENTLLWEFLWLRLIKGLLTALHLASLNTSLSFR